MEAEALEVVGKSRDEIAAALRGVRRDRIYDLVYQLATDPPQFRTATVARNRELHPRTVLRLIERGELVGQKIAAKDYRISLPALQDYDRRTRVGPVPLPA